ncbi:anaerobic sulfatase maturase [Desulfohalovibrio reitneri]|uniref:anaerobic sulfatase maturase n=1 Tax=Desulfohalovibrio reitneri TaxID=1307759 RepID=UPI0005574ED7|nr:anaerobic sulfatase maturase [Desulfohalovibrio reitneri]
MRPFSLLIKPAAADCNLRCDYCFYLDKGKLYPGARKHRMSNETLRALLSSYLETPQPVHSLVWQGGEPTLMGEAFFRSVTEEQKRLAPRGARIANSLQTNATLVKEGLAAHLGKYKFLVGCSIDGPADLHDAFRRTTSGRPTHARAVRGARTLVKHGVPVNAVALVSAANVDSPRRVYRHLLELGFGHVQFVPCVEFDESGEPLPFTITGEQWGEFLRGVFEEWHGRGHWNVSVRNFESVLAKMAGASAGECRLCEQCDQYLVVEYNGDIYPCDFYVDEEHRLGNVHDMSLAEARETQFYQAFTTAKSRLPEGCSDCDHLSLCMGDCPKFRTGASGAASWLCPGWRMFFQTTRERFESLARAIAARQSGMPRG